MGAQRFVFLVALSIAQFGVPFCAPRRAQVGEKRITPVDAPRRATFERERKVGVAILVGIGKYPRYSGLGELRYPPRDADLLESELSLQRYIVATLKDGVTSPNCGGGIRWRGEKE